MGKCIELLFVPNFKSVTNSMIWFLKFLRFWFVTNFLSMWHSLLCSLLHLPPLLQSGCNPVTTTASYRHHICHNSVANHYSLTLFGCSLADHVAAIQSYSDQQHGIRISPVATQVIPCQGSIFARNKQDLGGPASSKSHTCHRCRNPLPAMHIRMR